MLVITNLISSFLNPQFVITSYFKTFLKVKMSNRLEDTLARSRMILQRSMEITKRAKEASNILDYESTKPSDPFYNQSNSMSFSEHIPASNPQESVNSQLLELNHKVRDLENDKNRLERINSELKARCVSYENLELDNQNLRRENVRLRQEMVNDTERDHHIHTRKIQELEDRIAEMNQNYEAILNEKLDKEAQILKLDEALARLTRESGGLDENEFLELQRKYEDMLRSRTELQEKYNLLYSKNKSVGNLNKSQFQSEITQAKKQLIILEKEYKAELLELKHSYDKLVSENRFLRKKVEISEDIHKTSTYEKLYQTEDRRLSSHNHRYTPSLSNLTYLPTHFNTFESKVKENSAKIKQLEKRLALSITDLETVQNPLRSSRSSSRAKKPANVVKKSRRSKLTKSSSLTRAPHVKIPDQSRVSPNCILTRTRGRCKICEN